MEGQQQQPQPPQQQIPVRIPVLKKEYLDMIPIFTGQVEMLNRFLSITEKLAIKFANQADPNDFQNEYLMSSILAKIQGPAAEIVYNSSINTYLELKQALLNAYSDKRDHFTLILEMSHYKQQQNETPFQFYERVMKILNLLIAYLNNHKPAVEAQYLATHSRELALRILLKGLREPLSSFMKTKNPTDLNQALNILTNDFQFYSTTQTHIARHEHKKPQHNHNNNNHKFQDRQIVPFSPNHFNMPFSNPKPIPNFTPNTNYQQRQFMPHQQNQQKYPPQRFQQFNQQKPFQNKKDTYPQPMSIGSTNFTTRQIDRPPFYHNGKNYYHIEEIHQIDDNPTNNPPTNTTCYVTYPPERPSPYCERPTELISRDNAAASSSQDVNKPSECNQSHSDYFLEPDEDYQPLT